MYIYIHNISQYIEYICRYMQVPHPHVSIYVHIPCTYTYIYIYIYTVDYSRFVHIYIYIVYTYTNIHYVDCRLHNMCIMNYLRLLHQPFKDPTGRPSVPHPWQKTKCAARLVQAAHAETISSNGVAVPSGNLT